MGKINSSCFQLELYLQCGQGVKDKTIAAAGAIAADFVSQRGIYPDMLWPKQRKGTESLQQLRASCCTFSAWMSILCTFHEQEPHDGTSSSCFFLTSQCCTWTFPGMLDSSRDVSPGIASLIPSASVRPQAVCIMATRLILGLREKSNSTSCKTYQVLPRAEEGVCLSFHSNVVNQTQENFSDVITQGLIKKYSQFSNSLKTDYEINYYTNKHRRH